MSLLEAQEWLRQCPDSNESLYAVLAQLERGDETAYRMISVVDGKPGLCAWLSDADWTDYVIALNLAEDLIGYSCGIKNKNYEVTRVFIVEKDTGYRIVGEVDIDAPES